MTSPRDVCCRWQCHFNAILNVPGTFQEDAVNSLTQLPMRDHLDVVPIATCEEVQAALGHLKSCKTGKSLVYCQNCCYVEVPSLLISLSDYLSWYGRMDML